MAHSPAPSPVSRAVDSVVYVMQQPRPNKQNGWVPDISPAEKYGRIEFVFDAGDRVFSDSESFMRKAASRLRNFDPERDFLVWLYASDPAACWLTIMLLMARGHKTIRYLYWSKNGENNGGNYFPITLDVSRFADL